MKYYIYKITNNINKKVYIGLTTTSVSQRWSVHKRYAKNNYKKHHLYQSMQLYGIDNFSIECIDHTDNIQKLGELERYYIKQYNSQNPKYGYNITAGGEHNQYDANPRAKLTIDDVIQIRTLYKQNINVKYCWNTLYKDKISYSAFEKVYEGYTWKGIMMDVYTTSRKNIHNKMYKKRVGESNGNALYEDNEVLTIRKYYQTHTLNDTYKIFGKKSKSKNSFRNLINKSYKHLPIYNKTNKKWYLNNKEINILSYKPVSTILVSEK